jgi:hypothetical protein
LNSLAITFLTELHFRQTSGDKIENEGRGERRLRAEHGKPDEDIFLPANLPVAATELPGTVYHLTRLWYFQLAAPEGAGSMAWVVGRRNHRDRG